MGNKSRKLAKPLFSLRSIVLVIASLLIGCLAAAGCLVANLGIEATTVVAAVTAAGALAKLDRWVE